MPYPPEIVERIKVILLGFIQAHGGRDESDADVEARLYLAREALFRIPAPSGNRFIDDWDMLVDIAKQFIDDRGKPKISDYWELYWDSAPSNARSFRALVRPHAEGLNDQQFDTFVHRLRRNFDKHKAELLRQAHFSREAFIGADEAVAAPLADWLDKLGIRMEKPRNIKLGHKHKRIK